jgi:hypothetical protein
MQKSFREFVYYNKVLVSAALSGATVNHVTMKSIVLWLSVALTARLLLDCHRVICLTTILADTETALTL